MDNITSSAPAPIEISRKSLKDKVYMYVPVFSTVHEYNFRLYFNPFPNNKF